MLPEERVLLQKSVDLAEENNKMLRALTRSMVWGRVVHFIYWALIIGSTVGAYYFIQPYINSILGIYGGTKSSLEGVNSILDNFQN